MSADGLFSSLSLAGNTLSNRMVLAPLTRGRAGAERVPNDIMVEYYRQRSGAGLCITEATVISEEGIGWIRDAGGTAVLAHPARYKLKRAKLRRLIGEFKTAGGEGIEVVSGSHGRDDTFTTARHARDFRLLASTGSDYHGPEHPWLELGRLPPLPDGCRPVWHDWPLETLSLSA